ncbi:hypothetical protein D3C86_2045500 [compost metagenome]
MVSRRLGAFAKTSPTRLSSQLKVKTPAISEASRMGWKIALGEYASVPMRALSASGGRQAMLGAGRPNCRAAPTRIRVW